MLFDNTTSLKGFTGKYTTVDDLIARDTYSLQRIDGNFTEIADRMSVIIGRARSSRKASQIVSDDTTTIVSHATSFRGQKCPFKHCYTYGSPDDTKIVNTSTGKKLTINTLTEHLSRSHHVIEKGNEYGINAEEFYEHFMPDFDIPSFPFKDTSTFTYIPIVTRFDESSSSEFYECLLAFDNETIMLCDGIGYNRAGGEGFGQLFAESEFLKFAVNFDRVRLGFKTPVETVQSKHGTNLIVENLSEQEAADFLKGYEKIVRYFKLLN